MRYLLIILCVFAISCNSERQKKKIFNGQGEMAGEVTQTSVILQSRLTMADSLINGDLPGVKGAGRFEWSTEKSFTEVTVGPWLMALPENDFIIKAKLGSLKPHTQYYYRLRYGEDSLNNTFVGDIRSFRTLPGEDSNALVDFIVTSCYNYHRFHFGRLDAPEQRYTGDDRKLGYPGLSSIKALDPDFVVFTGDNVYYDTPQTDSLRAKTPAQLRQKWHEQLIQRRFIDLFSQTATFWEKDDHDHRFNDCDTLSDFNTLRHLELGDESLIASLTQPSHQLGKAIFREQVPVVDPKVPAAVTYRTHRLNKYVQIWLTENRDYRSPNTTPDGPGKTIWGEKQKQWLIQTLTESDAVFKLLISPTPLIGPDDAYKSDNHVNQKGFRYEGERFLRWVAGHPSMTNFYIVHGDRHWQYHSVHPLGVEEFSCGSISDANARKPRLPGDPRSTDPEGSIHQPYVMREPSGGFLRITFNRREEGRASLTFTFFDEKGNRLYKVMKEAYD